MTEERLKEIKDSIYIAHRISCDPAISMDFRDKEELYNEVVRLRKIIDKVKDEIEYFELQAKHLDDSIYLDETLTNKLKEILGKINELEERK